MLVVTRQFAAGNDVPRRSTDLVGRLEEGVARRTGRRVLLDEATAPRMDLDATEDALWSRDLRDYDGLVMMLEQDPHERRRARTPERLEELLIDAGSRLPVAAGILVAVTPPLHPTALPPESHHAFFHRVAMSVHRRATVLELPCPASDAVPGRTMAGWAESIADATGEMLTDPTPWLALLDVPRGPEAERSLAS